MVYTTHNASKSKNYKGSGHIFGRLASLFYFNLLAFINCKGKFRIAPNYVCLRPGGVYYGV